MARRAATEVPADEEKRPEIGSLADLAKAEAGCTRCSLHRDATQVVPGEGLAPLAGKAPLMLVGEQPGDREDIAGKPFVGPAGHMLDKALEEAGIARSDAYVTNAVKHFKHEMRGKRRLHKRPDPGEIERCRWWLDYERMLVRPGAILALGATAARSLLGRPAVISRLRGAPIALEDGTPLLVTIHPSYILRIEDEDDKAREYAAFVADLKRAKEAVAA